MNSNQPSGSPNKPLLIGIGVLVVMIAFAGGMIVYSMSDWSVPEKVKSLKNPVPAGNESIAAGMSIYKDRCANCHGERGDGRGEKAEQLSIAPSDFTDAERCNGNRGALCRSSYWLEFVCASVIRAVPSAATLREPFFRLPLLAGLSTQGQRTPRNQRNKVTEVMEQVRLTAFL